MLRSVSFEVYIFATERLSLAQATLIDEASSLSGRTDPATASHLRDAVWHLRLVLHLPSCDGSDALMYSEHRCF